MRRALVWGLRALGAAVVLLAVLAGAGTLWLRGSLPQTRGELALAGLAAPVEVLRDGDGLVTIRAGGERDAAFALGFVHAQDRLWQMDFMRRSGAGRLSEVVGPATRRLDRFMRALGLHRVAEANLAALAPATRAAIEAYTAGINAFLETRAGPLPLEFQILRYTPEPWRPADSLLWGRLMALRLSGNWTEEILRARVAKRLSPEQTAFLWPGYPADAPTTLDTLAALDEGALSALARLLPPGLAPTGASNAWVLAGSRTASGRPLLANDPHLALQAPGLWYLARIETPGLTRAGATAPGVPFVVAGHNGRIAWGLTTTHSDTQDLFVERLAEGDPARYRTPEGTRAFETRAETIEIKGEAPERVVLRASRHGPIVSDVARPAAELLEADSVLALAWPALRPDDRSAEALHGINLARDWREFRAALRRFHSPQQNIVYADRSGTIGFAAPARVPLRRAGDGRAPVPGWSGAFDWTGYIPFDELPIVRDPPAGRAVNANNKIVPEGYPYLLAADWPEPYRAERIERLLDAGAARTPEDARRLQLDTRSRAAATLLPLLQAAQPESDRGRAALELLSAWDGRMDRDRAAPLVFYAWLRELTRALLADELGPTFVDFERPNVPLVARVLAEGEAWCDDVTTGPREDCNAKLVESLETALDRLSLRFARPADRLRWGEAHVARFPHPLLSRLPLAGWLLGFEVATDGGDYTVNRAGVSFHGGTHELFENVHGPGYRAVYDLADLDDSRFMIATGQSGNPLSPHYGDLAARWGDGIYLKLDGDETAADARLRLIPK